MNHSLFRNGTAVLFAALLVAGCGQPTTGDGSDAASSAKPITKDEVLAAQKAWGDGIIAIGKVFRTDGGDFEARASEHIKTLYAYDQGPVLFKPTLASDDQYRETFEQALSYFVGLNENWPEDKGFAIAPYTKVRWDQTDIVTLGDTAVAMGNYYFTNEQGDETKVEYTFGYIRDDEGNLRINLHHSSLPYAKADPADRPITREDVLAAQKAWGDGIVAIGKVFRKDGGDFVARASEHIRTLYAYDMGPVLFKPTLASDDQYRETFEQALSYFVGLNENWPEDKGFAIAPYTKVRWDQTDIVLLGDTALAMGNYYFTNEQGDETKVEYTFGYIRDDEGNLRINLHHSSLPFEPVQ